MMGEILSRGDKIFKKHFDYILLSVKKKKEHISLICVCLFSNFLHVPLLHVPLYFTESKTSPFQTQSFYYPLGKILIIILR